MKSLPLLFLILSFNIHTQEQVDLDYPVVSIFIGEVIKGEIIERPENPNNLSIEELISSGKGMPTPWGKYDVRVIENIAGDKYTLNVTLYAHLWSHDLSHNSGVPLNPAPGVKYVFKVYYNEEGLEFWPYKDQTPLLIDISGFRHSVSDIKLGLPISFYYYDGNGSIVDSSVTPVQESDLPRGYFEGYNFEEYKSYILNDFKENLITEYQHYISIINKSQ